MELLPVVEREPDILCPVVCRDSSVAVAEVHLIMIIIVIMIMTVIIIMIMTVIMIMIMICTS